MPLINAQLTVTLIFRYTGTASSSQVTRHADTSTLTKFLIFALAIQWLPTLTAV